MELSLICDLLRCSQFFHQHDRFVTAFTPFFLAHPRCFEVARIIATDTNDEQKPSLTKEIERSGCLASTTECRVGNTRALVPNFMLLMREARYAIKTTGSRSA